jgi:TRAP-type C4-dicarboxylate transport system substrate-binding protein
MRILTPTLFGATVIGLLLSQSPLANAQTTLVYNNFTPPTHAITLMAKRWSAEASKASNGEVKFRFPAKTLAPPPSSMEHGY